MDRKKLERLRARYADDAPGHSHNPEFRKIIDKVFAGTDRRPKPYEGVSTFLDAPLRVEAAQLPDLGGLDVALVGVPMDLGVTNRPGARFGPSAVRAVERIGPYHHVHRLRPSGRVQGRRHRRCALSQPLQPGAEPSRTSRPSSPGSRRRRDAARVGGDHSITFPILKALGAKRPAGSGAHRCPLRHRRPLRGLPSSIMAARSARRCWPACSTPSAPSRSAFAAGPNTCGNSPTTAA